MSTAATNRRAVLCGWVHQGYSQSCCSRTPAGASEPARTRRVLSASCEVTQWCRRYVSDLPYVTPRYLGSEQKSRVSLLYLTLSSRLASLLLRWKAADAVFVVLSLSFQVWRCSLTVAMSLVSTPPLHARLHQHAWLLDGQHVHTFWRRWLAGQGCWCWREGAPGQIPVGRHSWGVVTCFFCCFRWWGWSCDC